MYKRILIPVDGSQTSSKALTTARPYRPKAGLASGTGGHCGKKCVYFMQNG